MPSSSDKNRRDYLVRRKFPHAHLLKIAPSTFGGRNSAPDTSEFRAAVYAYTTELAALSQEDLAAQYDGEKRKEAQELRAKAELEERDRFFNQPRAMADFEHWSKAAHWTLDEAIALSFGRAPEVVRWDKLIGITALGSPFVTQYARRRDLALRAKTWEQLYDPVLPGIFLAWAKRADIEVPPELIEAVEKRGVQVADWKTSYDEAIATLKAKRKATRSR